MTLTKRFSGGLPRRRWSPLAALALIFGLMAADAGAHARWLPDGSTPGRNDSDDIKTGPCGAARTSNPAVFKTGETVTLQWEATINHRGYFRIAFSPANDEGFDNHVLLDNIPERTGTGEYSAEVTLPDEPCDNCTLQLIQVMLDRNPPTNYYACADIQLLEDATSDNTPPQAVANLEEQRGLPDLRLRWSNPDEDFAGALVLHGAADSAPQAGTPYELGDAIGGASVVYVGAAQAVDLNGVNEGDWLRVYAFDMAYNYSASAGLEVQSVSNVIPPIIAIKSEQLGQPSGDIYAADGTVLLQATIQANSANGDVSAQWALLSPAQLSLEPMSDSAGPNQAAFEPAGFAQANVQAAFTATDSAPVPNVVEKRFESTVQPWSYYKPSVVLMQQGQVVSQVNVDNGPAQLRVVFEGAAPPNLDNWSTRWQHAIPNATEEPLALRFTPSASASYTVTAQVFTPTDAAADEQVIPVTVKAPLKLGVFDQVAGLFIVLCLAVWRRACRATRLQGAV
ncbi:MAG TPA: SCE4755 family polysaccharide monooxygenase-like protein [Marinagarivorans sp.]